MLLAGNSIGREFVVTSIGESHGKCVGVVIDVDVVLVRPHRVEDVV